MALTDDGKTPDAKIEDLEKALQADLYHHEGSFCELEELQELVELAQKVTAARYEAIIDERIAQAILPENIHPHSKLWKLVLQMVDDRVKETECQELIELRYELAAEKGAHLLLQGKLCALVEEL